MLNPLSGEGAMDEEFLDDDQPATSESPVAPLDMRRRLDDVLQERQLAKQLRDYAFDLDED